ncbi:NAD-dependent epimerase/dehydratase family protein [Silvanigrella paludirubra]|uniref:NAD-dependent epimerase/dehydratase family protein n=1 Tax=Silvanigrella paludirubra TaxID=2499159 RepID=UPI00192A3648|nr:NAD(P)-dependent oxidoreductase [Silvanigrella paludirubra]
MINNKNVLVIGGAGFLGSHVADELTNKGYQVSIFDNKPSKFLQPSQSLIIGDILKKEELVKACENKDFVFNFAGLSDINEAIDEPEKAAQLNIIGNLNALEASKINGIKRFVFASSIYVYSESGSFYRATKQSAEKFTELYWERYSLPFTILRYGSLYGRRADKRNAIFRMIYQALKENSISYSGTGDEFREYIHAVDAAIMSVNILEDEKYSNKHLILTGTQSYKIRDIMKMISEMLPGRISLDFNNCDSNAHYTMTPYSYSSKVGKKIMINEFVDLGQGILDCIQEISHLEGFSENG